jgi:hypothetical protein
LIEIRKKREVTKIKKKVIKIADEQFRKITSKNNKRYNTKNIKYKKRTGNLSVSKVDSKRPKFQTASVGQNIAHSSSHNCHFDSSKIFHLIFRPKYQTQKSEICRQK